MKEYTWRRHTGRLHSANYVPSDGNWTRTNLGGEVSCLDLLLRFTHTCMILTHTLLQDNLGQSIIRTVWGKTKRWIISSVSWGTWRAEYKCPVPWGMQGGHAHRVRQRSPFYVLLHFTIWPSTPLIQRACGNNDFTAFLLTGVSFRPVRAAPFSSVNNQCVMVTPSHNALLHTGGRAYSLSTH